MIMSEKAYLQHYGTPRRSGRYPWGSGEDPYQDHKGFLGAINDFKKKGMSEPEIAKALALDSTTQLRVFKSIAKNEIRQADISMAQRLKEKGMSTSEIGRRMGQPESTIRTYLAPGAAENAKILDSTVEMLKDQIEKKKYIDVGAGVEYALHISDTKMKTAIAKLEAEGYRKHYVKLDQLTTPHQTTFVVLTKGNVTPKEVYANRFNIKPVTDTYTEDGGKTWLNIKPPKSISSKRIAIRYAEEGGAESDGVIYVRPGVEDVSLGRSRYAQVRIGVDNSHFIKGMAVYKDDMPEGVDLIFNTNKSKGDSSGKLDAAEKDRILKPMKTDENGNIDRDNPFGASIDRQNGVLNIIAEEGAWEEWSKSLSSQMLSKQEPKLAKQQLSVLQERKQEEFDEIMALTNPAVRRHLLEAFSTDADATAVHLKAAELPRTANHVILPVPSLKKTEVYAPNYENGERVVLIRHPHGGIFEIPELTVNNKHRAAQQVMGKQSPDAIGIHPEVARKLSGADFDGDTVLVIPNDKGTIKTAPPLEGLKDFDPQTAFPKYEGMKVMSNTDAQMGDISNLITDMTIKGANNSELERAVRHSMVVIDAEKKELNYRLSAEVNGIRALKERYQGSSRGGASTIVSRKKREKRVLERKQGFRIDPTTGKRVYTETGKSYVDPKTGKTVVKTTTVNVLDEADDAFELTSGGSRGRPGTTIEKVYAEHSNAMKSMANKARLESIRTNNIPYSPSAREAYSREVASLNGKLHTALMNRPRERHALVVANWVVAMKVRDNPDIDHREKKKLKNQALAAARARTQAKRTLIKITPSEWDAIQAGAISNDKLMNILKNTDLEEVKTLATPNTPKLMTSARQARAQSMISAGYTQAEIAQALGVSLSTLRSALSGD